MGTSHAATAPKRKSWKEVSASMRSPIRNPLTIANYVLGVAIDVIPKGFIGSPISCGANEGIKFFTSVKKDGLNKSVKNNSIEINEKFIAFSISKSLWDKATSGIESKYINTPFGKLGEVAFKKSLNSVMLKGSDALEELSHEPGTTSYL